jgi:hypothetical protein
MVIEFKGTNRPSLTGLSVALVVRTARTTDSLSLTGHTIQKIHSLYGTFQCNLTRNTFGISILPNLPILLPFHHPSLGLSVWEPTWFKGSAALLQEVRSILLARVGNTRRFQAEPGNERSLAVVEPEVP